LGSQSNKRAMQARLGRSQGNSESGCNLRQFEVQPESKHQQRSIRLIQARYKTLDLVSRSDLTGAVRAGRGLEIAKRCRGVAVSPTPVQLKGRVDGDPAKPRQPSVGIPQLGELAPGANESLLGSVLGIVWISQD
jgi:hypothetical protein